MPHSLHLVPTGANAPQPFAATVLFFPGDGTFVTGTTGWRGSTTITVSKTGGAGGSGGKGGAGCSTGAGGSPAFRAAR